jgi:AcrR family transcriptional regulator
MTNFSANSTRARILSCAEKAYAHRGMVDFTLRSLSDAAEVNLAAINYHFRSKQALVEAMLVKVLAPLYEQRLSLLTHIQQHYGDNMQPTHIMAALLLPLMREISVRQENHHLPFMMQTASDTDPAVRSVLKTHYSAIGDKFEQAFAKSAADVPVDEALWRSRVFCNALPGSVNNLSTGALCMSLLAYPMASLHATMVNLGCLAESVLTGCTKKAHVSHVVADLFDTLREFPTFATLRDAMKVA